MLSLPLVAILSSPRLSYRCLEQRMGLGTVPVSAACHRRAMKRRQQEFSLPAGLFTCQTSVWGVGFSIFSVCLEKRECLLIAAKYLQLQLRIKCRKIDFLSI